jgi:ubiquinone/menaquinone biosynthesis C-methylase UbiE
MSHIILPNEIATYYNQGREAARLGHDTGLLELIRTQELLLRHVPPPPATIYDIGGGPGTYALWLAQGGYTVHLLDAIPLHITQAEQAAASQPDHPLASATVGDARHLPYPDASADVALLMGPLYHLTERDDRLAALREARRVLRPGGLAFAVAINRAASALDGLFRSFLDDPTFAAIVRADLTDGQHRNPTGQHGYFTTAYFHRPADLDRRTPPHFPPRNPPLARIRTNGPPHQRPHPHYRPGVETGAATFLRKGEPQTVVARRVAKFGPHTPLVREGGLCGA